MILLAALALAQVDPFALGRARADFGEIPNSGKWKFVYSGQFGGTEIFFPSGRADVRYYLVWLNGDGLRICKQSKRNGKIRKEWLLEVKFSNSQTKSPEFNSILGDCVRSFGLPKNSTPEVRKDLSSQCSYAVYLPQSGHSGSKYSFEKFRENPHQRNNDGGGSSRAEWRIPDSELRLIPRTKSPYPITPEELEEIRKGIAPAKN